MYCWFLLGGMTLLNIGDTIYLELMTKENITENQRSADSLKKYRCKLIDKKEDSFIVDPPVNESTRQTSFLMDGEQMNGWFIGTDNAVYSFKTEILGRSKDKIRSLILSDPGLDQYTRIQRRNYVRIDTSIDVAVDSIDRDFPAFVTSSVDISGGGMALSLPTNYGLKEADVIKTWIVLPGEEDAINYAKASCKVIRITHGESGTNDRCSLKFEKINEADRQKIIKYCFEQQLQVGLNSHSRNR